MMQLEVVPQNACIKNVGVLHTLEQQQKIFKFDSNTVVRSQLKELT